MNAVLVSGSIAAEEPALIGHFGIARCIASPGHPKVIFSLGDSVHFL